MFFRHGVMDFDEILILNILNADCMVVIRVFRLQCWQCDAAAVYYCISGGVDHVSADGADIEFGPHHIGGFVLICDMFSVHQFDNRYAQSLRKRLQKRNIRQSFGGFPFGDSLAADIDPLRKLRLGYAAFFLSVLMVIPVT